MQDGVTESNHGILDYLVVTSNNWLDILDPAIRNQFLQILFEVTQLRNGESARVNEQAKQSIIAQGSKVRVLTDEQRSAWVAAMKPVSGPGLNATLAQTLLPQRKAMANDAISSVRA